MEDNNKKKKKLGSNEIFITLGAIFFIVGFIIHKNPGVWSLGFIFLIVGIIGKFGKNNKE